MGRVFGKLQLSFLIIFLLALNVNAGGAIAGKVTIIKGQVFIQRGSQKIQAKKDDTILESDIIESEAGTARITMIDSNLVDVYPRSKVEIAKYVYKPNEDQKEVELKIDFGKIKSTVNQKYDGAKNKFQVKTPSAVAGVRGTVFTAEYDRIKKISKVVTIEGLVAVSKVIDRERQTPPVFVRPDQVVKVDIEQSKAEQPRDLKPEEREVRQKEDKDLGYQYDPKKDPSITEQPVKEPNKETIAAREQVKEIKEQAREQIKEIRDQAKDTSSAEPNKDNTAARQSVREQVKEIKEQAKERIKEIKEVRQAKEVEPVKEVSAREPVKQVKETLTTTANNLNDRQQARQQEQERRQKESEEEQAKKQKQLEEEQSKKQKQLEEEQSKKQKQLEEEQSKKQKQLEEEQAKKQKHIENEQAKKQQQLEEEMKRRAQEEAQKKAELARRLAEIAKRAETTIINRPPSGTDGSTTTPISTPSLGN